MDKNVGDYSGNGNNGTANSVTLSATDGKLGGAYTFSGSPSYISVGTGSSLDVINQLTVVAWIKPSSVSGYQRIFSYGGTASDPNKYSLLLSDNTLTYQINSAGHTNTSTATLATGNWYLVALTYSDADNNATVYVNNVGRSFTETGSLSAVSETGWIGVSSGATTTQNFSGVIDEVAVYNRKLTSQELSNLYSLSSGTYYWKVQATDGTDTNNSATRSFVVGSTNGTLTFSIANPSADSNTSVNNLTNFLVSGTTTCNTNNCGDVNTTLQYCVGAGCT
ncbi:MAG: LamG domain-containing protein, partial [Candidatus Woesearchaeota archaeon]|nr:LamG domain-containing protein [Candidatus Woesearchaeota archaeon]